jgi:hypothetical protein
LRERFQKSFLRSLFGLTTIAKEPVRDMKNSGAVASHNFREGRLVFRSRLLRQFEI